MKRLILAFVAAITVFISLSSQTASAAEWNRPKGMVITEQIPTIVFCAARGSNELPAIPLPGQQKKLRGDANDDGEIGYMDALLVLRHAVCLQQLSDDAVIRCDVDGSDGLTYLDALLILRYSVKLISSL